MVLGPHKQKPIKILNLEQSAPQIPLKLKSIVIDQTTGANWKSYYSDKPIPGEMYF